MNVSFLREIVVSGDYARVPLSRGLEAVIDATDAPALGAHNWTALKRGCTNYAGRNRLVADGKSPGIILMHRLLTNAPHGLVVDHKNGDGLDNRRSNLRVATQAENTRNTRFRKDNTSGLKGAFWDKFTNKWMAAICLNGKFHNLGRFNTPEEAHAAYAKAAVEKFGEFARLA